MIILYRQWIDTGSTSYGYIYSIARMLLQPCRHYYLMTPPLSCPFLFSQIQIQFMRLEDTKIARQKLCNWIALFSNIFFCCTWHPVVNALADNKHVYLIIEKHIYLGYFTVFGQTAPKVCAHGSKLAPNGEFIGQKCLEPCCICCKKQRNGQETK